MERTMDRSQALIANRGFLALWLGQLVSNLGDKLLQMNAVGFALSSAGHAGGAMAQVLIWSTAPGIMLGLAAGVAVDRFNRRHIMIVSDLVRAALLAGLPVAAAHGFWLVCLVIALMAAVASFFGPARTALIPEAVPSERLIGANAWFAASNFVTALVGTVLGTGLLVSVGLTASLWINAGVFGVSALVISLAPIRGVPRKDRPPLTRAHVMDELRAGCRIIGRHQAVRALVGHYALLMGVATFVYIGLVGASGHHAHWGLAGARWLFTAVVIGLIFGGLLAHALHRRRRSMTTLIRLGLLLLAGGALGVGVSQSLGAWMGWLVMLGAGGAVYASVIEATLQHMVPASVLGRVIAARGVLSSLVVLGSAMAAGSAVDRLGHGLVFGAVATACASVPIWNWATQKPGLVYRAVRWGLRQLAFAYFQLDVRGLEQIPRRGGVIVAGNHPNVLDGILLLIVSPRPVRFLVAEELYFHRHLHGIFRAMGCIPVYRTKTHNGDALRGAVAALQRGELLGIFPEGTTGFRGMMPRIKRGAALLALKTGCPVVPFAIQGTYEVYPPPQKVPRSGAIHIRFVEPVAYPAPTVDPLPEADVVLTMEDLRRRILRIMDR